MSNNADEVLKACPLIALTYAMGFMNFSILCQTVTADVFPC